MRLIDADALEYHKQLECMGNGQYEDVKVVYECDIDNAPTIDIAEVCGECRPYDPCIYCKHEFENEFERKEP